MVLAVDWNAALSCVWMQPRQLTLPPKLFFCRAGDFKKEVPIFMHRWVYGRGVPHLTVGSVFHRRGCMLEVAIRQSGSKAAMDAALAAEREAQREGIGTGVIKVAVHEGSGLTVEHPVHVGVASMVLQELRVNPEVKKIPGK